MHQWRTVIGFGWSDGILSLQGADVAGPMTYCSSTYHLMFARVLKARTALDTCSAVLHAKACMACIAATTARPERKALIQLQLLCGWH